LRLLGCLGLLFADLGHVRRPPMRLLGGLGHVRRPPMRLLGGLGHGPLAHPSDYAVDDAEGEVILVVEEPVLHPVEEENRLVARPGAPA